MIALNWSGKNVMILSDTDFEFNTVKFGVSTFDKTCDFTNFIKKTLNVFKEKSRNGFRTRIRIK